MRRKSLKHANTGSSQIKRNHRQSHQDLSISSQYPRDLNESIKRRNISNHSENQNTIDQGYAHAADWNNQTFFPYVN